MKQKHIPTPSSPKECEQRFNNGCSYHEDGRFDEAIACYRLLLELFSDTPILHYNLGLALFEKKQYHQALAPYQNALELSPEDPDILLNLALCQRRCGELKKAIDLLHLLLSIAPDAIDGRYTLALSLQQLDLEEEAISEYLQILDREKDHQATLNNIAYIFHKKDEKEKAQKFYERLLRVNPDHTSAAYMLSAIRGEECRTAPTDYVESVFDDYSGNYEKSLVEQLGYEIPAKLGRYYQSYPKKQQKVENCLDLGCGTGLAGEVFAPFCDNITGIDLSAKMLYEAEKKEIYDSLLKSDLSCFLQDTKTSWDLIVAADVFTYLGDLQPIFKACQKSAAPGCIFCFSVERLNMNISYKLMETGRFAHSPVYIREIGLANGWQIDHEIETGLRKEKGHWVQGVIYFFSKQK